MLRKVVFIVTITVLLLSLFPSGVLAGSEYQPPNPNVPVDCGVWADNPKKSGTSVNGKAEALCIKSFIS